MLQECLTQKAGYLQMMLQQAKHELEVCVLIFCSVFLSYLIKRNQWCFCSAHNIHPLQDLICHCQNLKLEYQKSQTENNHTKVESQTQIVRRLESQITNMTSSFDADVS